MPNNSDWEVFTEPRVVQIGDDIYHSKVTGIKREDGFTIILKKSNMAHREEFICKGSFGEFAFFAHRWDSQKEQPIDKYLINIFSAASKKYKDLIVKYSKDIESGLLNFPSSRLYNFKPVKQILFQINIREIPQYLLTANELQNG